MSCKLLLILITVLALETAMAQPGPPPSPAYISGLQQDLKEYNRQDTGRVNRLNQLASLLSMREPATAETLANEARTLAEKLRYGVGIAHSNKNLADVYFNTGRQNMECIQLFQTAADLYHQQQSNNEEASALHGIALVYSSLNRSGESLAFFLKALKITEATGDLRRVAAIHNNMGRMLQSVDQKESARSHYQQAITISEKNRFYDIIVTAQNNMMTYFDKPEDFAPVETALKKLLDEPAPPPVQPQILQSLGNIYVRTGRVPQAEAAYLKVLEHPSTRKGSPQEMIALGNLANLYLRDGKVDKAEEYAVKTLELMKATGQPRAYAPQQMALARVYAAQGKLKQAIPLYEEGLKHAGHTRATIQVIEQHHKELADMYARAGDSVGFYKTLIVFNRMKDSLTSLESQKQVADLHLRYETEKKEQQIALLGKEKQLQAALFQQSQLTLAAEKKENAMALLTSNNQLQQSRMNEQLVQIESARRKDSMDKLSAETQLLSREQLLQQSRLKQQRTLSYSLIAAAALLAALAAVLFSRYRLKQKANAVLNEKNEKIETLIRELHHRVKNNMQVISSLLSLQSIKLEDKDAKEAVKQGQQRVDAMAMIHQRLYLHADISSVDMREYIQELVSNLVASYNPGLKTNMDIAPVRLDVDTAVPLGLIANELITNSLKHAYHHQTDPGLWIKLEQSAGNTILLTVKDNGPGMQHHQAGKQSFGLKLVDMLTRQLKGKLEIRVQDGMEYQLIVPSATTKAA